MASFRKLSKRPGGLEVWLKGQSLPSETSNIAGLTVV
jgi:hypothetical protein